MSFGASLPGWITVSVPGSVRSPRRLDHLACGELFNDHGLLWLQTIYKVLVTAPQRLMVWVHMGSLCFSPGH